MTRTEAAIRALKACDALLVTAGAGMGVDSGLPDFRGNEGFWNAYPEAKKRGLSFADLANPAWFDDEPTLAWAFYGHRLHLYSAIRPHEGFERLLRFGRRLSGGLFVVTSNVDGQFQKSGFSSERLYEVHGSIHHLQCSVPCRGEIWRAHPSMVEIDKESFKARTLPECPYCGAVARPNILMFNDYEWIARRSETQAARFERWLEGCRAKNMRICIVEIGAGTAVTTIRHLSESIAEQYGATLIRINPRDYEVPAGGIAIPTGAKEGLEAIVPRD